MASITYGSTFKRFSDVIAVNGMNIQVDEKGSLILVDPPDYGKIVAFPLLAGLKENREGDNVIFDIQPENIYNSDFTLPAYISKKQEQKQV
jgi:multiple sugar transport system ATP-binding protein